ncbi:hypothetical protein HOLleu_01638 [Holothuria leucospilota]|uniref:Uncharacterized protein n=1 Tax=Holothuria leucospilota TaxID=206669 RepID=A0A9Q1CQ83_HOLLE|nr:hypothetical protein HOLleu_01638 [Holothuria leucospilota]
METLMDQLTEGFAPQDRVGIELSAPSLTHAVWIPLMRRYKVTRERIFRHIEKLIQSNADFTEWGCYFERPTRVYGEWKRSCYYSYQFETMAGNKKEICDHDQ